MLQWIEASVSRSNRSTAATRGHASRATTSTYLQLLDRNVQSEDPSKNKPNDLGVVVPEDPGATAALHGTSLPEVLPPAIPASTAPCGTPPMPGTLTIDATTSRQWATGANKVWFLSSAQCFLQNSRTQNTENQDRRHAHTGKIMAGRTMDWHS
jgi:hypothetical protein